MSIEQKLSISIAREYTRTPGGRYRAEGDYSGEDFRLTMLHPKFEAAVARQSKLIIELDGVAGYATSFLEEAFGGLVRQINRLGVSSTLEFVTTNPVRLMEVTKYISDAEKMLR